MQDISNSNMHFTSILRKLNITTHNKNGNQRVIAVDRNDFKDVDFLINGNGDIIIHAGNLQIKTVEKI
jgi:hypothetical protein